MAEKLARLMDRLYAANEIDRVERLRNLVSARFGPQVVWAADAMFFECGHLSEGVLYRE